MKKIILDCSWNPGEYNFVLTWDDNKAHYVAKHFHLGRTEEKSVDVDKETFKKFLNKLSEVDLLCLSREYLPADRIMLEDAPLFNFLYEEENRFCASTWQIGTEDEDIIDIENAIAILDPKFNDLFPNIMELDNQIETNIIDVMINDIVKAPSNSQFTTYELCEKHLGKDFVEKESDKLMDIHSELIKKLNENNLHIEFTMDDLIGLPYNIPFIVIAD